VVGQGYTARLVGLSTITGVPRGVGPILAPRDRHSAEFGPEGLGAGRQVPGRPAWGSRLIYDLS
jgi:hypothetical protein